MLLFGGCVLAIGVFIGRPYCRYLCPYGAILRVLSRLSKWHVRIPPEACINCRLCEDACPYDAIQTPTVAQGLDEQSKGRRRLVWMLVLAPLLVALGSGVGRLLGEPLSGWHPQVRLAEQLRRDELGLDAASTDAADAYRNTGRPLNEAYATALDLRRNFRVLGVYLGAWVGLVVAAKLVRLSLRRPRVEYQPNRSGCVSCGRCFWYCPVEQVRLGLIADVHELLPEAPH
jgi:ferredoxin